MESIVIWLSAALLVLFIALPALIKHRRKNKETYARKKEAEMLGADKPVAQYPQMDYYNCIGCGACIEACPENSVLGLVHGKATIINGLKCIGHGKCAEACPVGGIKVGLGDIKNRDDIPLLSEQNETNIPGMYIAGELAGLALIKNAINQGAMVVENILQNYQRNSSNGTYDLIIIGAGPAGLSAALTAIKNKLY